MFARFDKNPAMTLQDIKETKCYGRTHALGHTHARTCHFVKNYFSEPNSYAYGQCVYIVKEKYQIAPSKAVVGVDWPCMAYNTHTHARTCHLVKNYFF